MREICRGPHHVHAGVAHAAAGCLGVEHIVTNNDDSGAGSLRDTVATAAPGDTITFASGLTTITLGEIAIGKNLSIQGSGLSGIIVQRDGVAPKTRCITRFGRG